VIIDSKIRIVIMMNYPAPKKDFFKYAADIGLDDDDLFAIFPGFWPLESIKVETPQLYDDIKGLLNGVLVFA